MLEGELHTTIWQQIYMAAGHGEGEGGQHAEKTRQALSALCQLYWYPIYAFIRRRRAPEDALELTQQFFTTQLLPPGKLSGADETKGRFRYWLFGAVKRFLANEWKSAHAAKRDIDKTVFFDGLSAEQRYTLEPQHAITPEHLFDRSFSRELLEQARAATRAAESARGRGKLFDALERFIPGGEVDDPSYQPLADSLGMSTVALRQAVFKLRQRYGRKLRELVRGIVRHDSDVADELRFILETFSRSEPEEPA
jgi:RNA polymerase sigma-70 factor (ECF subfamily)